MTKKAKYIVTYKNLPLSRLLLTLEQATRYHATHSKDATLNDYRICELIGDCLIDVNYKTRTTPFYKFN